MNMMSEWLLLSANSTIFSHIMARTKWTWETIKLYACCQHKYFQISCILFTKCTFIKSSNTLFFKIISIHETEKNLIYRVISEYTNEYWQHYPYYYINLYNGNNTHQSFLNNPRSKLFSFNAYFYVVIENYRYCDVNVTRR